MELTRIEMINQGGVKSQVTYVGDGARLVAIVDSIGVNDLPESFDLSLPGEFKFTELNEQGRLVTDPPEEAPPVSGEDKSSSSMPGHASSDAAPVEAPEVAPVSDAIPSTPNTGSLANTAVRVESDHDELLKLEGEVKELLDAANKLQTTSPAEAQAVSDPNNNATQVAQLSDQITVPVPVPVTGPTVFPEVVSEPNLSDSPSSPSDSGPAASDPAGTPVVDPTVSTTGSTDGSSK